MDLYIVYFAQKTLGGVIIHWTRFLGGHTVDFFFLNIKKIP